MFGDRISKGARLCRGVRAASLTSLFALLVGAGAYAQADAPAVEAALVAFALEADGNRSETPLNTDDGVLPGQVLEYELSYKNVSDEALSDFVVLGDVPDETVFESAGAFEQYDAVFEVEVPGIGWSMLPVIRYVPDEHGVLIEQAVPSEEFEALRWRLLEPVFPGEEISISYRIKINK